MDDGGAGAPPYHAARKLFSWAVLNWNILDGKLLLAGLPGGAGGLTFRQLCNVAHVEIASRFTDEAELVAWEDSLAEAPGVPQARSRVSPKVLEMMAPPDTAMVAHAR